MQAPKIETTAHHYKRSKFFISKRGWSSASTSTAWHIWYHHFLSQAWGRVRSSKLSAMRITSVLMRWGLKLNGNHHYKSITMGRSMKCCKLTTWHPYIVTMTRSQRMLPNRFAQYISWMLLFDDVNSMWRLNSMSSRVVHVLIYDAIHLHDIMSLLCALRAWNNQSSIKAKLVIWCVKNHHLRPTIYIGHHPCEKSFHTIIQS